MCVYVYMYIYVCIYICITGWRTPQCECIYIYLYNQQSDILMCLKGGCIQKWFCNKYVYTINIYICIYIILYIWLYIYIYCKYTNNHQPNYQLPPQSCRRNSPWASTSDTNKAKYLDMKDTVDVYAHILYMWYSDWYTYIYIIIYIYIDTITYENWVEALALLFLKWSHRVSKRCKHRKTRKFLLRCH
jgi:hypothetical protein